MQTIDEVKDHCRFVAQGIVDAVAAGEDWTTGLGNPPILRFKVVKDGNDVKVVGGEIGGDDSGIVISEEGVTKIFAGQIVGYQFDEETSAALREFFETLYNS